MYFFLLSTYFFLSFIHSFKFLLILILEKIGLHPAMFFFLAGGIDREQKRESERETYTHKVQFALMIRLVFTGMLME